MSEETKKEVPAKFKTVVEEIEKLSMVDMVELVKVLEERFGVSAAAPVMMAGAIAGGSEGAAAEEKTSFSVELKSAGAQKIQIIKAIRELTGLGLKEAKDIADGAPKMVKENVAKTEADEMKKKLEEVGATVELK
ncbi:MAG TPA: 50S ribosomal protein L7/L12 [Candidatus Paceibacterota bacterium]